MLQVLHDDHVRSFVGVLALIVYGVFEARLAPSHLKYIHQWTWLLIWGTRHAEDPTRWGDLALFCLFYLPYSTITSVWTVSRSLLISLAGLGGLAFFFITVVALTRANRSPKSRIWKDYGCTHPLIHRCRTTHTRMFPKKHTFSYHYLQVSVPVGFRGKCGSLVSVDTPSERSWLHVRAEDYLQRDSPLTELKPKLSAYLQSQGVDESQWDHAYLVTAPRFMGYSFNPVSFWYVYDSDDRLSMMILEVNNTFDERRLYLLKDVAGSSEVDIPPTRFNHLWPKDFHVSPFNSRKGHYALQCLNPFRRNIFKAPGIDSTIVLSSSKDRVKLVARLFSEEPPVDPLQISHWDRTMLLLQWCWMGFFTFPRILKEAFLLFFRRKLHVWLRPEVMPTSMGRRDTRAERSLEPFFAEYLEHLVQATDKPLKVNYKSGLVAGQPRIYRSSQDINDSNLETLQIYVLSPVFFTRFVQYRDALAAFKFEGLDADPKYRTVFVSSPDRLASLLEAEKLECKMHASSTKANRLTWYAINVLRHTVTDDTLSSQDQFVALRKYPNGWLYRRLVIRQLLARRLAFGAVGAIDVLDVLIRAIFLHLGHRALHKAEGGVGFQILLSISYFGIHLWAMIKGP